MQSNIRMGAKTWCDWGMAPRHSIIKINGALREVGKDGKLSPPIENSVTTVFKNKSAQGAAAGTFLAVDTAELTFSDVSTATVVTTKVAGGSGIEDYVTFQFDWKNVSGSPKTINDIDMGYDMGLAGEAIYFQVTGLTKVVADQETIRYLWTITVAHSAGGVTALYRYGLAEMMNTGTFIVPTHITFIDTGSAEHAETASLEEGGTGAEAYHQWTATYTAVGAITIDIIELGHTPVTWAAYTSDDITDKALVLDDTLQAHVKITHA